MVEKPLDRFDELYRRVAKTSKLRFIASRRLVNHHKLSQWTIALLSVALTVIPLVQALGVTTQYSAQTLNVVQVSLAVLVLVFSLLLGMDNHLVRSEKMHSCGLELGDLARILESYKGKGGPDVDYKMYCERYHNILRSYENHTTIDYYRLKLEEHTLYYPGRISFAWGIVKTCIAYFLNFFPYVGLLIVTAGMIWLMLK